MGNQQPSINLFFQKPTAGKGYIYKYTSPSGKSYIGQTVATLKERAKNLATGQGYKKCSLFWRAIEKYGFSNFSVKILEEVNVSDLNDKEVFYIEKYNTFAPNGYNQTFGGEGGKRKTVYVYSAQNGKLIEKYPSITEASVDLGVAVETISLIMNKNNKRGRRQAHNMIFSDCYYEKYDLSLIQRKNYRSIYVYNQDGTLRSEHFKMTDAAKELGISISSIYRCLDGRLEHYKGFRFLEEKVESILPLEKKYKPLIIYQIDNVTGEVLSEYPSYASAARGVGLASTNGIKRVLKRGYGTSGGYFWKTNDEGSTTK